MGSDAVLGRRRVCAVGLTGGLASGKSTVARELAARGVPVLDADRVVHELYRPGAAGAAEVRRLFGPGVLDRDGGVDREALGALVASDAGGRRRLEEAVHPLVRRRIRSWLAGRSHGPAVVEAALLVETGSWRDYDVLAVVWCRPDQQLERAVARGVPVDRARALLAAQAPIGDKRALAHVVVDNSGPPRALADELERAWLEVVARCTDR